MDVAERARGHHLLNDSFAATEKVFASVKVAVPVGSELGKVADDLRAVAQSYFEQAKAFRKQGDMPRVVTAVACARAWLDVGVRLGLLDGIGTEPFNLGG